MIPDDLFYTECHLWVRPQGECVEVGVSEPLIRKMKPLISIELTEPEVEMKFELPFGEVEGHEETRQLYPPSETRVLEVNDELLWDHTKLVGDPYGAGWLMRIIAPETQELLHLMTASTYREFCAKDLGKEFADG